MRTNFHKFFSKFLQIFFAKFTKFYKNLQKSKKITKLLQKNYKILPKFSLKFVQFFQHQSNISTNDNCLNSIPKMTFSAKTLIQHTIQSVPEVSCEHFWLVSVITLVLIKAFISTTLFFIVAGIKARFEPLDEFIPADYENYLTFVLILALLTVLLVVYGCCCVDNKSPTGLTAFLVLTSVTFVALLVFIAFFMDFTEKTVKIVGENFENSNEWQKMDVEGILMCSGSGCKEVLMEMVEKRLRDVLIVCSIVVGLQVGKFSANLRINPRI